MIRIVLLLLTAIMFSAAWAEEKIEVKEVVVTATRVEESVEETTSDVIVINREDISEMNVQFIPDVLKKVPAINMVQNGGVGKTAAVLLRGGSSAHTLVMIDGIKVNSTSTGSYDFSGIAVDDIERIEIVNGPQSTIYGSEAMAGVINIITKKGEGEREVDASFEAGSFGTFKPAATISGGDKKLSYRLTGSYFYSDGISAAEEGSERDGYENARISGKVGIRTSDKIELELNGYYYYDRSELDDFDFFARMAVDDPNFLQRGHHFLLSGKGTIYLTDIWEQILTVSTVSDSLKFRDPDDVFNNFDIDTDIARIDWQHNVYIHDSYILTAGAEYRREEGENKDNFNETVDIKALYLNNKISLLNEDFIMNAGLRYDDYDSFGDKMTYRIGAIYTIKPVALKIRGSYGTGFRAPALNELFFPFFGNPDLDPEESEAWELGLEKEFLEGRLSLALTYFDQSYEDLIDTDPLTFTAQNIAEADVRGIEISGSAKVTDAITVGAGYTYLDTEDRETGDPLSLRPDNKISLSAAYSTTDLTLVAYYTFVDERFDSSVQRDLASYSLVNLSGTYKASERITLFGRIDNLFDENYEESGSYGTPGLSVFGGVTYTLL